MLTLLPGQHTPPAALLLATVRKPCTSTGSRVTVGAAALAFFLAGEAFFALIGTQGMVVDSV